jgi:hypothetical protein
MNVGILSMQKVKNYGSFLQAFAMKKTIEFYNHNCEFIDIEKGQQLKGYKRTFIYFYRKFIEYFGCLHFFRHLKNYYQFRKRFNYFLDELEVEKHILKAYDLVIIGSDEVFNIAQFSDWGFTLQLFGKISNAKKIISYAGTFGNTTLNEIYKYKLNNEISSSLKNLSCVSVRDDNSKKIIQRLLNIEPFIHIDPVLFFNYNSYIRPIDVKDFILIYSYPARIRTKEEINNIRITAKKFNKKLISIGFLYDWCDETVTPHPFEVLSYFISADYIITDTFHGTLLSIKYNKQFATMVRSINQHKLWSLLDSMLLGSRAVLDFSQLEIVLLDKIDYIPINKIIAEETKKANLYLQKYLNE